MDGRHDGSEALGYPSFVAEVIKISRARIPPSQRPPRTPTYCKVCNAEIPYSGKGRPRTLCERCVGAGASQNIPFKEIVPQEKYHRRPASRPNGGRRVRYRATCKKKPKADELGWPGTVQGIPFTIEHFKKWAAQLVFEDGKKHPPEQWQLEVVQDIFDGYEEVWLLVPEGNSKTTLIATVALYHLDNTHYPWVPIGASSRDQAEILFSQAKGFVERTPGFKWNAQSNPLGPFQVGGTRKIGHTHNVGEGLKVYAADVETADGVIPTLALLDEGHRHKDLGLYRTWTGKLNKRDGQIIMISTAGVPGHDFEVTRDKMRRGGRTKRRRGECYLRSASATAVLHEYAVPNVDRAKDIGCVKEANPLTTVTKRHLRAKYHRDSLDYGDDWLRKTCNIPARSSKAGIADADWERAYTEERIPEGVPVIVGIDFAFQWDTTAVVPLWIREPTFRLIDRVRIITPPRDGTMLHPDVIKSAVMEIHERNPIVAAVVDKTKAQDTVVWLSDSPEGPRCIVVDRTQTGKHAVEDYAAFTQALRGGRPADEKLSEDSPDPWIRWTGNPETDDNVRMFNEHVMNAIARKIPGDRYVFDRPSVSRSAPQQDVRVIDGLVAAGFANYVAEVGWEKRPMPLVKRSGSNGNNGTKETAKVALKKSDLKKTVGQCNCGHGWDNHEGGDHSGACAICGPYGVAPADPPCRVYEAA